MSEFIKHYTGRMSGVLRWPQLDEIWHKLDAADGWYLYEIGTTPPAYPVDAGQLATSIQEIDAFLRKQHDADYCGVVYTDSFDKPSLLKLFHPRKMGASCGSSGATVLPKWTLSQQPPVDLLEWSLKRDDKPVWWKHMLKKPA